jgi:hypothetical protein
MSNPVQPTSPIAPVNAPVSVQGASVAATNPAGSSIPAVNSNPHPGFIRNSPSGELIAASAGGGYATVEVNGVALTQEDTLNLVGVGVAGADVGGVTTATFTNPPDESITSFATSPTLYQVGHASTNQAFTATYADPPTTAVLTDNQGNTDNVTSTPAAFVSPHTVTKIVYAQSVTYTLSVTSPEGNATRNSTITWAQKVWWGSVVDPGVYDSAFINSLSNSVLQLGPTGTFATNCGAGQSTFYATRTAFGVTALNFRVNGLPFAISKVAAAVAYTNSDGITENYDVWRSDNISLGAFSFTES